MTPDTSAGSRQRVEPREGSSPRSSGIGSGIDATRWNEEARAAVLDRLRSFLEDSVRKVDGRLEDRLWEPLRREADRLGTLRDQALKGSDPLREAGRAVRLVCDGVAELSPPEAFRQELISHLDRVLTFAHVLPRKLPAPGERQPAESRWRRRGKRGRGGRGVVEVRRAVRVVLRSDYPHALASSLDAESVVMGPPRSLPSAPADLTGEEDYAGRLLEAVEASRRATLAALEEATKEALECADSLLSRGGLLARPALWWRLKRSRAHRRTAVRELTGRLKEADEMLAAHLSRLRFTADLARRERALGEAAEEAAELLAEASRQGEPLRELARRLASAGQETAGHLLSTSAASAGSLEILGDRFADALAVRRRALPDMDRAEGSLSRALDRLAQLSSALASVAEEFVRRGQGRGARPDPPNHERTAAVLDDVLSLGGEISRHVAETREILRETEGIVHHGLQAARSKLMLETPDREEAASLVRETCSRAASRLQAAADRLDADLADAASVAGSVPERILSAVREWIREASVDAPGTGSAGGRRVRWKAILRLVRRRLGSLWRRIRHSDALDWLALRSRKAVGRIRAEVGSRRDAPATASGVGVEPGELKEERIVDPETVWEPAREPDGEGLPAVYLWMFRDEPVDDPQLLVGRSRELQRLRALRERWESGAAEAVALVGEPGSGKTSLLNCAAAEYGGGTPVRTGRIDRRISDAGTACRWLARFLGLGDDPELSDPEIVARAVAERDRREVVLLENGERLFRRHVGGYGAASVLGRLIRTTGERITWIVSFARQPWLFLRQVSSLPGAFAEALQLDPLSREELEEAVMLRHRLTGYPVRFVQDGRRTPEAARETSEGGGSREALRTAYFDELHSVSASSVGAALRLWRASLLPPVGDGEIRVRRLRTPRVELLSRLSRERLFVLAAFVLHGDLREEDLTGILERPAEEVSDEVDFLRRCGVLRPVPGLPAPPPLRVDAVLHGAVLDVLRERRVLDLWREGEG